MCPQLISSFHRPPSPQANPFPGSGNGARDLLLLAGTVTTYHGRNVAYDMEDCPLYFDRRLISWMLDASSIFDEDRPPSPTQDQPMVTITPINETQESVRPSSSSDWTLDQFLRLRSNDLSVRSIVFSCSAKCNLMSNRFKCA